MCVQETESVTDHFHVSINSNCLYVKLRRFIKHRMLFSFLKFIFNQTIKNKKNNVESMLFAYNLKSSHCCTFLLKKKIKYNKCRLRKGVAGPFVLTIHLYAT